MIRDNDVKISDLIDKIKEQILDEIVDYCVEYAGDSYSEFGSAVTKLLVRKKLVKYGD